MSESAKRLIRFFGKHIENATVGLTVMNIIWITITLLQGKIPWENIASLAALLTVAIDIIRERKIENDIEDAYTVTDVFIDLTGLFALSIIPAGYLFQEMGLPALVGIYWISDIAFAYWRINKSMKIQDNIKEKLCGIGIQATTAREMLLDFIENKDESKKSLLKEIKETNPELIENGLQHLRAYEREKIIKIFKDMHETELEAKAQHMKEEIALEGSIASLYIQDGDGCAPLVNRFVKAFDWIMRYFVFLQGAILIGFIGVALAGYGHLLANGWLPRNAFYFGASIALSRNAKTRIENRKNGK